MKIMVTGNWQKHLDVIERTTAGFRQIGLQVLSPIDVEHADLVWVVAPDGVPESAACFDIGQATCIHTPIFSADQIHDTNIRTYVVRVPDVATAIGQLDKVRRRNRVATALARRLLRLDF